MKKNFLITLFTIALLSFFSVVQAQTFKQSVYFSSGHYNVSKSETAKLSALIDSCRNYDSVAIGLQGNSDNIGRYKTNKLLSAKRAASVQSFFIEKGTDKENITVKALGPANPVASNKTKKGRQLNRRVDILIQGTKFIAPEATDTIPDISELFAQLRPAPQTFCIDPNKDTVIRCKQGTVIHIKANSLIPNAACNKNCVTFIVREVFSKSDMLLENLTTTSDGQLIETQGMIYTDAVDCLGNKLKLQEGKKLTIVIPTDSINPDAKIFDGHRTTDSIMNWTVNDSSVLSSFTLPQLVYCGNLRCVVKEDTTCKTCHFFFCRIGRLGAATKGMFNTEQHERNVKFRQCQKNKKRTKATAAKDDATTARSAVNDSLQQKCPELENLFKKYGVNNVDSLINAIIKPLLDSFKVSNIQQLNDTLRKLNTKKVELSYVNRNISFDDFRFYVYDLSTLGWSNVDVFANVPVSQQIVLKVNLNVAKNIDCKLLFKNRRAAMPAVKRDNKYQFERIPKDEQAYIVAIKYEDGVPFLAIKEITTAAETFDVEFKKLTLEELKAQLKQFKL